MKWQFLSEATGICLNKQMVPPHMVRFGPVIESPAGGCGARPTGAVSMVETAERPRSVSGAVSMVKNQGCRCVPYTFSETIRHGWYLWI